MFDYRANGLSKPLIGVADVPHQGRVPWLDGFEEPSATQPYVKEARGSERMLRTQLGDTRLDKIKQGVTSSFTYAAQMLGTCTVQVCCWCITHSHSRW